MPTNIFSIDGARWSLPISFSERCSCLGFFQLLLAEFCHLTRLWIWDNVSFLCPSHPFLELIKMLNAPSIQMILQEPKRTVVYCVIFACLCWVNLQVVQPYQMPLEKVVSLLLHINMQLLTYLLTFLSKAATFYALRGAIVLEQWMLQQMDSQCLFKLPLLSLFGGLRILLFNLIKKQFA